MACPYCVKKDTKVTNTIQEVFEKQGGKIVVEGKFSFLQVTGTCDLYVATAKRNYPAERLHYNDLVYAIQAYTEGHTIATYFAQQQKEIKTYVQLSGGSWEITVIARKPLLGDVRFALINAKFPKDSVESIMEALKNTVFKEERNENT